MLSFLVWQIEVLRNDRLFMFTSPKSGSRTSLEKAKQVTNHPRRACTLRSSEAWTVAPWLPGRGTASCASNMVMPNKVVLLIVSLGYAFFNRAKSCFSTSEPLTCFPRKHSRFFDSSSSLFSRFQKREFTRLSRDVPLRGTPCPPEAGAVATPGILAAGDKNAIASSELRPPPCRARVAAGRARATGRRGLVHGGCQRPQEWALGKLCM